jgi:hypothetical protein
MYLSTLRSYVEALGVKLELRIRLSQGRAVYLHQFVDAGVYNLPDATRRRCGAAEP